MKIYKEVLDGKKQIVIRHHENKFIIGIFNSGLYWIMLDYIPENNFTIKRNNTELFEFIDNLFLTEHFNNCTFNWLSESSLSEHSSSLKITKGKDYYRIKFIQNPNDSLAKEKNICPICFCLNGSKNPNITNKFTIMFNQLLNRDFD